MNNYYVRDENMERLKTLAEEYQSMGRDTKIEGNCLTVFATKQAKPVEKKKFSRENRNPHDRNND